MCFRNTDRPTARLFERENSMSAWTWVRSNTAHSSCPRSCKPRPRGKWTGGIGCLFSHLRVRSGHAVIQTQIWGTALDDILDGLPCNLLIFLRRTWLWIMDGQQYMDCRWLCGLWTFLQHLTSIPADLSTKPRPWAWGTDHLFFFSSVLASLRIQKWCFVVQALYFFILYSYFHNAYIYHRSQYFAWNMKTLFLNLQGLWSRNQLCRMRKMASESHPISCDDSLG